MDEHERSTPTKRILLAAVTLLLLSTPLNAHANIIYTWTGTCVTACIGQATMLVVTTDAYIPGQTFRQNFPVPEPPPVLLRALYADNNVTFDFAQLFNFPGFGDHYVWPDMPPNSSGAFFGEILEGEDLFTSNRSNVPGLWRSAPGVTSTVGCPPFPPIPCYDARGVDGVWTRLQTSVPAPSTLVLLGVGLAGLLVSRQRRRLG